MDTFDSRQTLFIEVVLPLNLASTFTYRVPYELNEEIIVGKRVSVPFGKRKVLAGLIFSISENPPKEYEARYIFDVLDNEAIVQQKQIDLWVWMASYYMCSIGLVYNAALPAGLKMEGESKMILHPEFDESSAELDDKEILLIECIRASKELSISHAADMLKLKSIYKYIKSLYQKGAILLKEDLEDIFKPKKISIVTISKAIQVDKKLNILFDELELKAKNQLAALMTFISHYSISGEAEKKELIKKGASAAAVNALITKGILEVEQRTKSRLAFAGNQLEQEELQPEQKKVLAEIKETFRNEKPAYLFGITGSGKTHVYSHLIKDALDQKKQVLYLLPEIALTSQLISRLEQYFGDQLVVSHSKFSNNERVEVYQAIAKGDSLLVVGTRSALFQPFTNLGLIIVDEEHESSYKQNEPAPRFNARDTALYLATKQKTPIILGSATPAIESFFNAKHNKFGLSTLYKRYDGAILPHINVVDMQEQKKQKRIRGIFSDTLLNALEQTAAAGKQSILFQNKKGYVPVLECNVCAWTPKCKNCDISLTYYKYQDNLRCHYCGYTQPVVNKCAACGNTGIELIGYGTERIEDELALYLPNLKIARLDYNATRLKNAHTKIINAFAAGEIDVLIGTQMVAKGLDFENVQTVGVLNADHLLNFPDFRANERAFQLLTQVAGRAGRRKEQGEVYIQTSKPEHSIIQKIVDNDYLGMYESELVERELFNYPPHQRLVKITLKHRDALVLYKLGQQTKDHLHSYFGANILGPEKPYVSKIRNLFILNFVLKIANQGATIREQKLKLRQSIGELSASSNFKNTRIIVDVDPM